MDCRTIGVWPRREAFWMLASLAAMFFAGCADPRVKETAFGGWKWPWSAAAPTPSIRASAAEAPANRMSQPPQSFQSRSFAPSDDSRQKGGAALAAVAPPNLAPAAPTVPYSSAERPASASAAPQAPMPLVSQVSYETPPALRPGAGVVLHVNEAAFDQQVLRSDAPVLVDFYAKWCGPCKALAPTLDELAAEHPHALVVKVDIDDSPGLAQRYDVKSLPTLLVFKRGQVVAREKGVVSKSRLASMLAL